MLVGLLVPVGTVYSEMPLEGSQRSSSFSKSGRWRGQICGAFLRRHRRSQLPSIQAQNLSQKAGTSRQEPSHGNLSMNWDSRPILLPAKILATCQ
jgi:hypothetical protein